MPHLVIEYSSDIEHKIDIRSVMQCAHRAAAASGIMHSEDIKVRSVAFSHYLLANPEGDFVHITCRLLAGRTAEQKADLSATIRRYMVELLPDVYSISVEVVDMDPNAYKKRVLD